MAQINIHHVNGRVNVKKVFKFRGQRVIVRTRIKQDVEANGQKQVRIAHYNMYNMNNNS